MLQALAIAGRHDAVRRPGRNRRHPAEGRRKRSPAHPLHLLRAHPGPGAAPPASACRAVTSSSSSSLGYLPLPRAPGAGCLPGRGVDRGGGAQDPEHDVTGEPRRPRGGRSWRGIDRRSSPRSRPGFHFCPTSPPPGRAPGARPSTSGVMSLNCERQTLRRPVETQGWGTDLEVTPGLRLSAVLPDLAAERPGYAARLTFPFAALGRTSPCLQLAYLRFSTGGCRHGGPGLHRKRHVRGLSHLFQPVAPPAARAPRRPRSNPVRSFSTYPYLGAGGTALTSASPRPGPGSASRRDTSTSAASEPFRSGQPSRGPGGLRRRPPSTGMPRAPRLFTTAASYLAFHHASAVVAMAISGRVTETWIQRWTPRPRDVLVSGGAASPSSRAARSSPAATCCPSHRIASAYHTDARHTVPARAGSSPRALRRHLRTSNRLSDGPPRASASLEAVFSGLVGCLPGGCLHRPSHRQVPPTSVRHGGRLAVAGRP